MNLGQGPLIADLVAVFAAGVNCCLISFASLFLFSLLLPIVYAHGFARLIEVTILSNSLVEDPKRKGRGVKEYLIVLLDSSLTILTLTPSIGFCTKTLQLKNSQRIGTYLHHLLLANWQRPHLRLGQNELIFPLFRLTLV